MKNVRYGRKAATVRPAAGLKGILCRSVNGEYFFRIKTRNGRLKDYYLRHSDLEITIVPGEDACLYEVGAAGILDHCPRTLGLTKV